MTVGGPSAPNAADPLLGRVLSERYRILSKLGEGGMGVVYLAEHVVIEKKIALKVLFPDLTRRADLVHRFMQEAKSASRIGHENVIDITDFGQSPEGYVFIAMEYLSGQDLGMVLKASGPMPWSRAQPIVVQIVKALRAAHEKGIVHRDMKPENIFVIPRDDGREFVKVLDFGIAKVMGLEEDAPRLTRTGMIFGTPEYMSPEQAQGQHVDHRVDIYAVGCIMYQILTGKVPFLAETFMGILSKHMTEPPVPPRNLNPGIDPGVEAIILRAMEKNPAKRFQSMRELVIAMSPPGTAPDLSGAINISTGLPVAPRTVLTGSLSQPGGSGSLRSPVQTPVVPDPAGGPSSSVSLPYATHQMAGRASMPLATPNLEARKSKTEVFERPDPFTDGPPARARTGSGLGLIVGGVLVAAVVGGVLVFMKAKAPAGPSGSSATPSAITEDNAKGAAQAVPGATGPTPAEHPAGNAATPTEPAARPAVEATGKPAVAGGEPLAPDEASGAGGAGRKAVAKGEAKAEPASADARKHGGKHQHRSSREAVESLGITPNVEAAPPKPTVRTPAELKNPFAP